ncbi:unnamed protein product [Pleuronectes platessa]|uniref:Uncharacterized protein n=1 Tax=Pleuronectes platessa TaxID=8262 RepID=A0A9N7UEI3_PLEPL|nr:unnamed protein product [Pleuronectes platessa]
MKRVHKPQDFDLMGLRQQKDPAPCSLIISSSSFFWCGGDMFVFLQVQQVISSPVLLWEAEEGAVDINHPTVETCCAGADPTTENCNSHRTLAMLMGEVSFHLSGLEQKKKRAVITSPIHTQLTRRWRNEGAAAMEQR